MALRCYRKIIVKLKNANEVIEPIVIHAGDEAGRIIRAELLTGATPSQSLDCKLWIDLGEGELPVYQQMYSVIAAYPAWEAAVNTGGLEPGQYDGAFRIQDDDGSYTETYHCKITVKRGILRDAHESQEMLNALDEFETRTRAALDDAAEATDAANKAATDATEAAEAANAVVDNVDIELANDGTITVTDKTGTATTYTGVKDASIAAENINAVMDENAVVTVTDRNGVTYTYEGVSGAVQAANNLDAEVTESGVINVTDRTGAISSYDIKGYADSVLDPLIDEIGEATDGANEAAQRAKDAADNAEQVAENINIELSEDGTLTLKDQAGQETAFEGLKNATGQANNIDAQITGDGVIQVTDRNGDVTSYDLEDYVDGALAPKIEAIEAATNAAGNAAAVAGQAAIQAANASRSAIDNSDLAYSAASSAASAADNANTAANTANEAAAVAYDAAESAGWYIKNHKVYLGANAVVIGEKIYLKGVA